MKLTIKTLDQRNYQVETAGLKTVWDLKRKLFNTATTNILPERQQLMYAGQVLKDKKLLSQYSIDERKFLLVMLRKPSRATNSAVNIKPTNNNSNNHTNSGSGSNKKGKRLVETKVHKPNAGQGDEPDIVCTNKRKYSLDSKKSTNPKQIKRTKTTTTVTANKSVKIKPTKDGLPAQGPIKKVKIMRMHKSTTSTECSAEDECIAKRHFPTSTSSINSSDSQRTSRHKIIKRNKSILRNSKKVKSNVSLSSTSSQLAMKRTNNTHKQHTNRTVQSECDEFVLKQIVSMGYNEEDVRRALIANFNDPNEAVDYLIQQVQERIEQQTARKEKQQEQQKQQQGKQEEQQQQQQQEKHRKQQKHCRIIAKVQPKKSNALAFLRHDPDFKNLRRVLRKRPNVLQNVIKRIGAAHPELLSLLKEHEDDFLQLLHETSVDSDEDQCNNCMEKQSMHISPEEEKIIARLVRMGFKRQMVILAFIACDRNVEKAVDYLCRIGDIQI